MPHSTVPPHTMATEAKVAKASRLNTFKMAGDARTDFS
jgi:hypothetical protein